MAISSPTQVYKVGCSALLVFKLLFIPSNIPSVPPTTEQVQPQVQDLTQVKKASLPSISAQFQQCGVRNVNSFSPSLVKPGMKGSSDTREIAQLDYAVAGQGEWPWMAYIEENHSGENKFLCGGSLIRRQWIVTAAHCISHWNSPQKYSVTLGKHFTGTRFPTSSEVKVAVEKIVRHDFQSDTYYNDIALLKLQSPVEFSSHIRPVCLPEFGYPIIEGRKCIAVGWGQISEIDSKHRYEYAKALRPVNLTLNSLEQCKKATEQNPEKFQNRRVTSEDKRFCATGENNYQDTCKGDSGGPLMCEHNGVFTLVGITSFGTTPCGLGLPGVYTETSHYHQWITSITGK